MSNTHIVYTGSYPGPGEAGLACWRWDPDNASLVRLGASDAIPSPAFVLRHPSRPLLFVAEETDDGGVWSARVDDAGTIEPVNRQPTGGAHPCHVSLDPSGRWLIATNYSSGSVAVFPVNDDGSLGERSDLRQHEGSGPNAARQDGPHAHSSQWTPDGRFVIVADLGIDRLLMYTLDTASGKLEPISEVAASPGSGPRHMVFDTSGLRLFVANELGSTLASYDYDPSSGRLSPLDVVSTLPPGAPENTVADIHLAGSRVLVSNRGHNSLAVFDARPDGGLPLVTIASCGGDWPRNFAVAPGATHVLVANQNSGEVVVLPLGEGDESIGEALGRYPVTGASCVIFAGAEHG